ncbi:hypothetical protein Bca52824_029342 [Brassica carinata]|uniref:Uncharacterized protein n=1 Tax=Brassica carinata TaxID=52824 RepID=A0A8X8APE1_BRACI|nr:hypothetical protein Bca52824_029342 [Brassica carinata]
MKRKENENENNEGFEYQKLIGGSGHSNEKGEEEKAEEEVEAELRVETEEVEAYKEPEVEEEGGVEVETEPRVDAEQDKEKQKGEETMNEGNEMGTETRVETEEVEAYKEPRWKKRWSRDGNRATTQELGQRAQIWGEGLGQFLLKRTEQELAKETNEPATDKGAEGAENDPKPRGRPRKSTDPKKFTTPKQRTRTRSQWISSPYTEADTNEIEGLKKKKPRTEA